MISSVPQRIRASHDFDGPGPTERSEPKEDQFGLGGLNTDIHNEIWDVSRRRRPAHEAELSYALRALLARPCSRAGLPAYVLWDLPKLRTAANEQVSECHQFSADLEARGVMSSRRPFERVLRNLHDERCEVRE